MLVFNPHNPDTIRIILVWVMFLLPSCFHPLLYAESASAFTQRQVWGLVVRHERALRAICPRPCISDALDPVHRLFGSVRWLHPDFPMLTVGPGAQANVALLRLLASYAASALKAAGHGNSLTRAVMAGVASDRVSSCWAVCRRALISTLSLPHNGKRGREAQQTVLQVPELAATATAALFLLLPRLAVLPSTGAAAAIDTLAFARMNCKQYGRERILRLLASCHAIKLMHGSILTVMGSNASGRTCTRQVFDMLGDLASAVAHLANKLVTQGCQGASAGSAALRILLAGPLLRLLRSPLLDVLASLQHVPSCGSWQAAKVSSGLIHLPPWGLAPLNQMPETMQPDVAGAPIAMQVRGLGSGLGSRAWAE